MCSRRFLYFFFDLISSMSLTVADEDDGAESARGLPDFSLRVSGFREGGRGRMGSREEAGREGGRVD
jgi:hypothetical protein